MRDQTESGRVRIVRCSDAASPAAMHSGVSVARLSGAYVLRIVVCTDLSVTFGRLLGGRPSDVPAGEYAYVGSAMGRRGQPLASRLLRHATRSNDRHPHPIRTALIAAFERCSGAAPPVPTAKTLHWHVDYLLDDLESDIAQAVVLVSRERMEPLMAERLLNDPATSVLVPGLGAGDADEARASHLLRVCAPERWWEALPNRLSRLCSGS